MDDPTLLAAQARLEERRAREGLRAVTPQEAAARAETLRRAEEPLEMVLARAAALEWPVPPPPDMGEIAWIGWTDARVPERLCRIRWGNIAGLLGPARAPVLGGVKDRRGRVLRHDDAVRDARGRLTGARRAVVVASDPRMGKSALAAAVIAEALNCGERARWTAARDLKEPGAIRRALGATFHVLDGVGEEMAGAPARSGVAAQRCEPVAQYISDLEDLEHRRLLVTTYMDLPTMADFYGGNVAARVYEGAEVIEVVR